MRLAQRHGLDTETRRHDRGDRDYREVQNTEILQYHKLNLPCLNALQFLLFYNALDHDIKITFSTLLSLQRCHCAKSSDDKPSLLVRYLSRKRCTSIQSWGGGCGYTLHPLLSLQSTTLTVQHKQTDLEASGVIETYVPMYVVIEQCDVNHRRTWINELRLQSVYLYTQWKI